MLFHEVFSAVACTILSSAALGYCHSCPNFNRRWKDVLDCIRKSKYSRYRDVVPDWSAKVSAQDSSITHRSYRIACRRKQFNTIALWGKHWLFGYKRVIHLLIYYVTNQLQASQFWQDVKAPRIDFKTIHNGLSFLMLKYPANIQF